MGKGRKVSAATYPAYFYHFLSAVKRVAEPKRNIFWDIWSQCTYILW